MRVLGFMTGTSLDGIDMAILETDGETLQGFGPAAEAPLPEALRDLLSRTIRGALQHPRGAPEPPLFAEAARAVAEAHFAAGSAFLRTHGMDWSDLDLVGMHGQTVLHERRSELRRELNGLVGAWHHRTGQPHGVTHAQLRTETGGPAAAQATVEQLQRRIDLLRRWALRASG